MTVLGIDTSTAATAVCVERSDGVAFEVLPQAEPHAGRPGHARQLMPAIADALGEAGVTFADLGAIAVGVGPGSYTGLRIGIATARALAEALRLLVHPVSSLAGLAAGADAPLVMPVIDARREEAFAALYAGAERRWPPFVAAPGTLAERVRTELAAVEAPPLAVGDGSVRFRGALEAANVPVPPDESQLHAVRALHVCRLAAVVAPLPPTAVLPDYLRTPDTGPSR